MVELAEMEAGEREEAGRAAGGGEGVAALPPSPPRAAWVKLGRTCGGRG